MRSYRDPSSPWGHGVFYEDHEFESVMDEMRGRAGKGVFERGKGVDVDLVLKRVYDLDPDFVPLPEGTLGRTTFHPDGRLVLEVSIDLADRAESSAVDRRRLRSTMAHEGGHVGLHQHLYCLDNVTGNLFGDPVREAAGVLCRGDRIKDRPDYGGKREWWEYQANRGMAALLLPASQLRQEAEQALHQRGLPSVRAVIEAKQTQDFIYQLVDVFDVSFEMMVYRLQDRGWLPKDTSQLELGIVS